jgi:hypothetical protein
MSITILGICYLVLIAFLMTVVVYLAFELLPCPIWHWQRGDLADRIIIVGKAFFVIAIEAILIACAVGVITVMIRM